MKTSSPSIFHLSPESAIIERHSDCDVPRTHIELNNGVVMPSLGLGTYRMEPKQAKKAVLDALSLGYRHIDTAAFYGNERAVGRPSRRVASTGTMFSSRRRYGTTIMATIGPGKRSGEA